MEQFQTGSTGGHGGAVPTPFPFLGGQGAHGFDGHGQRGGLQGLQIRDLTRGGVVVENHQFSAEAGVEGFCHAEGEGDGHGGIGGVAALFQDADPCLGGLRAAGDHDPARGFRLLGGGGRKGEKKNQGHGPAGRVRRRPFHHHLPAGEDG